MKPSLASCWYPFRSPEVKAIYDNLTAAEAARLQQHSWKTGTLFGVLIFGLLFLLLRPLAWFCIRHFPMPWGLAVLLAIALPLGLFVGLIGGAPIRNKAKKILCDSAYAKGKGYTPENLRLYSFGKL